MLQRSDAEKYANLVEFILRSHDASSRLAEIPEAPDFVKGMADAESDILKWVAGLEGTDLKGLREKFPKA